jgi:hypothetical protein
MHLTKSEEYTLMNTSPGYELKTTIKGGKTIKWLRVWDHKAFVTETQFKTLTPPPYEHKLISYEIIDLMPVANKKIYKVTIKKN